MKITVELDEETFENAAAAAVHFYEESIENYILDLMESDFHIYHREINDIKQGYHQDEEYCQLLERYKNESGA